MAIITDVKGLYVAKLSDGTIITSYLFKSVYRAVIKHFSYEDSEFGAIFQGNELTVDRRGNKYPTVYRYDEKLLFMVFKKENGVKFTRSIDSKSYIADYRKI
ncbi:MAG: hypothetical protein J6R06_08385 [Bacteroidales bacterium]|nr:hypothetical protein [Bacteroidales bacterium]